MGKYCLECGAKIITLASEGYCVCSRCGLITEIIFAPRPLRGYIDTDFV